MTSQEELAIAVEAARARIYLPFPSMCGQVVGPSRSGKHGKIPARAGNVANTEGKRNAYEIQKTQSRSRKQTKG